MNEKFVGFKFIFFGLALVNFLNLYVLYSVKLLLLLMNVMLFGIFGFNFKNVFNCFVVLRFTSVMFLFVVLICFRLFVMFRA